MTKSFFPILDMRKNYQNFKGRVSLSHTLGLWPLCYVAHSKYRCVFDLEIQLQFVTLDGAKFGKFHHDTLSQC